VATTLRPYIIFPPTGLSPEPARTGPSESDGERRWRGAVEQRVALLAEEASSLLLFLPWKIETLGFRLRAASKNFQ